MNNYTEIQDFKHKQIYTQMIERKLFAYLSDMIYKPMFKMLKLKPQALNDLNVIKEALDNGALIYKDGVFTSSTRKFSNTLSKELIKLGAKYNKYLHGYVLEKIPDNLLKYIKVLEDRAKIRIDQVNSFIEDMQNNLDTIVDSMVFDEEVITILDDTGKQITKNVQHINLIVPELTEEQKQQIAQTYTNNMQYYIKKWTESRIVDMRTKVKQAILDGYREEQVVKMLKTEYGIGQRKAEFLAHNETNIVLSEVKKAIYTDMGFEEFKWHTRMDGRERESHRKLNNTIWRFDEPPIIDERTGQRGLPGQTYNCRCILTPIRHTSPFVKDDYNKSENLKTIIKYDIKANETEGRSSFDIKDKSIQYKNQYELSHELGHFADVESNYISKELSDAYDKSVIKKYTPQVAEFMKDYNNRFNEIADDITEKDLLKAAKQIYKNYDNYSEEIQKLYLNSEDVIEKALMDKINKDKYLSNWGAVVDIYDALAKGRIKVVKGHGEKYFKNKDRALAEIFANYYQLRSGRSTEQLDFIKENLPKLNEKLETLYNKVK